ncbi:MAG: Thioredoxin [Parcubacteria group bacterium GW2011_GWA2_38_13]|nr:MAG: Thioredoxin [Parcubacteria group bacterium GW2011_GWA2_38_13]
MEKEFNDKDFETLVLKSDFPVLVDFWAPWCGPCRIQGPIVEELARQFEGKNIKIGKMNVDENIETAQKFGIMSIPTLILFKNGKIEKTFIGLRSKEELEEEIKAVL